MSNILLRLCIIVSSIFVIAIYFIYRPLSWPGGFEALGCLVSLFILVILAFLHWFFRNKSIILNQQKNISLGLTIGLLWTLEIAMNNLLQPHLPLRDIADNIFWAAIAALILVFAVIEAFKKKTVLAGIISGFWSGTGSGAIACLTALSLVVFGMHFILTDPVNLNEWSRVNKTEHYPNIQVYFAYETLAGALMHFVILGTIMGLILGIIGGVIGKSVSSLKEPV
jgi:hypothetical protein